MKYQSIQNTNFQTLHLTNVFSYIFSYRVGSGSAGGKRPTRLAYKKYEHHRLDVRTIHLWRNKCNVKRFFIFINQKNFEDIRQVAWLYFYLDV